jgi:hypothetical protein
MWKTPFVRYSGARRGEGGEKFEDDLLATCMDEICAPRTNLQTRTGDMSGYQWASVSFSLARSLSPHALNANLSLPFEGKKKCGAGKKCHAER